MASFVSPPRNGTRGSQQTQQQQQHAQQQSDLRSGLPRRFTTDSGYVPTLSSMSMTSPQRGPDPASEYNVSGGPCSARREAEEARIWALPATLDGYLEHNLHQKLTFVLTGDPQGSSGV